MDYIAWEINLRNRLTALRLRDSDKNVANHTILPGSGTFDFSSLLTQVDSQRNPLDAERVIDGERLRRISHCQGADPFSIDAILAFMAGAAIYSRWEGLQAPYDMDNFLHIGG
jgi:vacuolar-type H+-ATPase subunit C/Vma6